MKINEIQDLIKFVAKSGVSEVELELKDFKIVIKTTAGMAKEQMVVHTVAAPVVQAAPPAVVVQTPAQVAEAVKAEEKVVATANEAKYITIKSPMIGTFYRSSSPDKPSFVNIGDDVTPGKAVCIIEAMKLFNEIESDVKGKIVKVLVNDASPVEYDQPLFLVDPS